MKKPLLPLGMGLLCGLSLLAQNTNSRRAAIDAAADKIEAQTIAWRRDFHEHPELGNREFRTPHHRTDTRTLCQ